MIRNLHLFKQHFETISNIFLQTEVLFTKWSRLLSSLDRYPIKPPMITKIAWQNQFSIMEMISLSSVITFCSSLIRENVSAFKGVSMERKINLVKSMSLKYGINDFHQNIYRSLASKRINMRIITCDWKDVESSWKLNRKHYNHSLAVDHWLFCEHFATFSLCVV